MSGHRHPAVATVADEARPGAPRASGPPPSLPKTRVWGSEVLAWPRVGPSAGFSPDRRWGFPLTYDEIVSGSTEFISRDPMVMQTRSAYGYVGGNPLNATDPNGLCIWDACVGETFGLIDILFGAAIFGTAAGATEYALHSGHGFDASSCPLNPPIPPSPMSAPLPANVLLAKGDIEQVNETASSRGWSKEKRQAFGRYLEESKRHGDRGTQNDRGDYTWPEMQGQADDFEQGYHGN